MRKNIFSFLILIVLLILVYPKISFAYPVKYNNTDYEVTINRVDGTDINIYKVETVGPGSEEIFSGLASAASGDAKGAIDAFNNSTKGQETINIINDVTGVESPPTPQGTNYNCGFTIGGKYLSVGSGSIEGCIAWFSYEVVLRAGSWASLVSGTLLNKVVTFTIQDFAKNIATSEGTVLDDAWTILRDFTNIIFIFVLLYSAIKIIIGMGDATVKKTVISVIVAALLINFSLFFTKVVVDVGNSISIEIIESINNFSGDSKNIADAFMTYLGLEGMFDGNENQIAKATSDSTNIILVSLGGFFVLVVLAVVMLIASIMLLTRFIVLIVVLIFSAVAFGSYVLPQLKSSISDKWFNALIGQTFMAPIFFIMLYISLSLMNNTIIQSQKGSADWISFFISDGKSTSANIGILLNFGIVIGLLIVSIIVSKSLADRAGSGSTKLTKYLGGSLAGATGLIGRQTVGRVSRMAADSRAVQALASRSAIGRGIKSTLNKGASGSFDFRASSGVSKVLGATGTDLGSAGGKGGYRSTLEKQVAAREKAHKEFGELSQSEKEKVTKLKGKLSPIYEKIDEQNKKAKELEARRSVLDKVQDKAEYDQLTKDIISAKRQAYMHQQRIDNPNKSDPMKKTVDEINKIEGRTKTRQAAYLKNISRNILHPIVGTKNKQASANIRSVINKKRGEKEIDKTLAAFGRLEKKLGDSGKKEE